MDRKIYFQCRAGALFASERGPRYHSVIASLAPIQISQVAAEVGVRFHRLRNKIKLKHKHGEATTHTITAGQDRPAMPTMMYMRKR